MIDFENGLTALPLLERFPLEMLLSSTACVGAAWLLAHRLKRRSAALRSQIWLAAFLAMAVFGCVRMNGLAVRLPIVPAAPVVSGSRPLPQKADVPPRFDLGAVSAPDLPAKIERAVPRTHTQRPPETRREFPNVPLALAVLWAVGAGFLVIRTLCGAFVLSKCARSSNKPPADSNLARVAAQMPEIRSLRCEIRLHAGAHSPICFGLARTWILLPRPAQHWSENRLRFVLQHEIAHGERRDYATAWLIRLVTAFCWPNPLAWLGQRQFRQLCEEAVDDRVASKTNRVDYAGELLLILKELRPPEHGLGVALSMAGSSSPRTRIGRLLDDLIDRTAPSRRQTAFIIAAGMGLALACGAIKFVRAQDPAAPVKSPSASAPKSPNEPADELAWLEKLKPLRVETPPPQSPPKPEDFTDTRAYSKAAAKVWAAFWAKEYPRLWKLFEADQEFLSRFPKSERAPSVRKEMIDSALRCLNSEGPIGRQAQAWASETLRRRDLSAEDAVLLFGYQLNMIGIMSGGGNLDEIVPVPGNSEDIPEAATELLALFAKRFPGTPELGSLYFQASGYFEREDRAEALRLLKQARSLAKAGKESALIDGALFRLTAEGKPAPEVSFTAVDGAKVDVSTLKGKVVLLDFWATWCPPCIAKLPELRAIYDRWHGKGLEVIGISLDSDRGALEKFIAKEKMSWPQYFDGKGPDNPLARDFGVQSIPSVWIIDQQGRVAAAGAENPASVIEKLLPGVAPLPLLTSATGANKPQIMDKGRILVRVVDSNGKPVAGVTVHRSVWTDEKFKANADFITNVDGAATVSLPHTIDILRLWASKETYVPLFVNWEPGQGAQTTIPNQFTFTLSKGTQIGGFVVNEAGEPLEGARVEVMVDSGNDRTGHVMVSTWLADGSDARITDHRGFWSLDNVPAGSDEGLRIKVSHPGYINDKNWGTLQKAQGVIEAQLRQQTAKIVMSRGIVVSGAITDPKGMPIPNAVVVWGEDPYRDEGSQEVHTDARGIYQFPPLPAGPLTVTVIAPGWSPEMREIVVAPALSPQDFKLQPGKPIRIQFVDAEGKPVPNVGVSLQTWRHKRSLYNVRHPNVLNTQIPFKSDSKGLYEWTWAPDDTVKFTFGKDGCLPMKNQMMEPGEYRIQLSK